MATLNGDLESTATELAQTHRQLLISRDRIVQLEAQVARLEAPPQEAPPQEAPQQEDDDDTLPCPALSPPRKRLRYGEPGASTQFDG